MLTASNITVLRRIFSSTVFRELATFGRSASFAELAWEASLSRALNINLSLFEVFDAVFKQINKEGCRDEYVFKSAIIQKILLGRHSLNTTTMLSEKRIGARRADLILVNGSMSAFEVKSDRDSIDRLPEQLYEYMQAIPRVNVVTSEKHIKAVTEIVPAGVGIILLTRDFHLREIRPAKHVTKNIRPAAILDLLRIDEAGEVLKALSIPYPEVPNTEIRNTLQDLFTLIPINELLAEARKAIKRNRSQARLSVFLDSLPSSLKTLGLSVKLRKEHQRTLQDTLNLSFGEALNWR